MALLVAGGIWALYGSPWLRVEKVHTSGTDVLTHTEVETAAAVPVGAPLISVDTDGIEARLRRSCRVSIRSRWSVHGRTTSG